MTRFRWRSIVVVAMAGVGLCGTGQRAQATLRFGDLQVSGNLQSQNLIRHPDASTYQLVQNRNVARLRLEYNWLKGGKLIDKYDIPFVERSQLTVLWRGIYDSIYTFTPDVSQKRDIHGNVYGLNANKNVFEAATQEGITVERPGKPPVRRRFTRNLLGLEGLGDDALDAYAFENSLREAYIDVKLRGVPLTIRAGRQQIVWGETDNFRMLDRASSMDYSWHFQQEIPPPAWGWDEIRRPAWQFKFLYDLTQVGPLSQSFLEWFWNPGDWYPTKHAFLPRPWGLPFYDPLRNPYDGAFYFGQCTISDYTVPNGPRRGQRACNRLIKNTKLFGQGDWHRNPKENSQVGVRYHGITPQGLQFTLNYFYQRFDGSDGTNYAPLSALLDTPENARKRDRLYARGIFPVEAISPYVHTIGLSANYSDEQYTQAVFRFETVYDVGLPFFDVSKVSVVSTPALPGVTKKNMWKGMIGFDRPTWIRPLNKKSTFFISGQWFWHYMPNHPSCEAQTVANLSADQRKRYRQRKGECLVGGLDLPSGLRGPEVSFRDKIRAWESIVTLASFAFYRGGSVIPTAGIAIDVVNSWGMEPFWAVDWVVRDDFVVNIGQRYFVTPKGTSTPIFETWGLAGLNSRRSETHLRLTYQF